VEADLPRPQPSMLAPAIGLTLDGVFDLLLGRVLLVLAALALMVVTANLPLFYIGGVFAMSVALAWGASLLAVFCPHRGSRLA
jgi:hypothetical protein